MAAAAATTAANKDEPNPIVEYCPSTGQGGHGSDGSSLRSQFEKDLQQIRRKRCMLLSLALHLAGLVLVNAVAWAAWAYTRPSGLHSEPAMEQPEGPPWGLPIQVEEHAGQPDQFFPPGVHGEIHEHPHAPCPWPAWVTFGTVTLFFFHTANLLPLIMMKPQSGCPPWNYWVVANLAGVVGVLWAVFLLTGGPEYHEFPWPSIFTVVALGTCLITTTISCLSGAMKRYVEGG